MECCKNNNIKKKRGRTEFDKYCIRFLTAIVLSMGVNLVRWSKLSTEGQSID